MTTQEFSDQFDVLYNNITSNQAPGLNEYEKSVFLTKAQDEVLKNYFLPQSNPKQAGFDDNRKRQIDFSMLIDTASLTQDTTNHYSSDGLSLFDPRSWSYAAPADMMFIINEQIVFQASGSRTIKAIRQVIPISLDEYTRLMSKPYKEPLKYQAWRLITNAVNSANNSHFELILREVDKGLVGGTSDPVVAYYNIRYIKRPTPIVLDDFSSTLGENISIDGVKAKTECVLDPILHQEVLQRAVELAKIAWAGEPAATVQSGQRSE